MNPRNGRNQDKRNSQGRRAQDLRAEDRSSTTGLPPLHRRVFCNRTLNLRTIRAVGCDMDYTLIHYHTEQWEGRAYEHVRARLAQEGWPVRDLVFDQRLVARGLIVDQELGNVLKADRFGFVRRACHGMRMLEFDEQRKVYGGVIVDLHDARWTFMNTFFSLSEACLFLQLVDLHDAGQIKGVSGYAEILRRIRLHLNATHMEGQLKEEIIREPEQFVDIDPDLPLAMLDLKHAGKRLMLITNSEWSYTRAMMSFAFDRFLPGSMSWRDLFDVVIVSARKPEFFSGRAPLFEVVDDDGLLRPASMPMKLPGTWFGGNAALLEEQLGLAGEEFLYVGDHIFADVHASKSRQRWRTALVIRELQAELQALEAFEPHQRRLDLLMSQKETLEHTYGQLRLRLQRVEAGYGPRGRDSPARLHDRIAKVRSRLLALDEQIAPLARQAVELLSDRWGLLMRAGNDKSHLARQIERYADMYMSRVSNLLEQTPFAYLRAPRGSLPHDRGVP